uniref:MSP domain-containing protein n=1 Tax=Panagrolaimus sp. JU765 TaxID=591449 RepID=A0AC34RT28_9BILA
MIGEEEKLEYSRPQDYYDDFEDEFSDDENNSDAPRNGKNGIVLPSHLSHILESSEDSDEESESIPSLKEQSFRSIINQEKLLEKEIVAVKKRVKFQIDDDRQSREILRIFKIGIVINPNPVLYFGFVPVNDSSTKSVIVFNPSDKKIHIRPELYSETFFLNSRSTILMPKQEKEFQVQFMPKKKRYFSRKIYFHVGETKFSHKLIGFGGAAECILMNPKLKLLQNTQYCLRPKDPTSFDLTVTNVGDSASFMHIVAVNRRGEII